MAWLGSGRRVLPVDHERYLRSAPTGGDEPLEDGPRSRLADPETVRQQHDVPPGGVDHLRDHLRRVAQRGPGWFVTRPDEFRVHRSRVRRLSDLQLGAQVRARRTPPSTSWRQAPRRRIVRSSESPAKRTAPATAGLVEDGSNRPSASAVMSLVNPGQGLRQDEVGGGLLRLHEGSPSRAHRASGRAWPGRGIGFQPHRTSLRGAGRRGRRRR